MESEFVKISHSSSLIVFVMALARTEEAGARLPLTLSLALALHTMSTHVMFAGALVVRARPPPAAAAVDSVLGLVVWL